MPSATMNRPSSGLAQIASSLLARRPVIESAYVSSHIARVRARGVPCTSLRSLGIHRGGDAPIGGVLRGGCAAQPHWCTVIDTQGAMWAAAIDLIARAPRPPVIREARFEVLQDRLGRLQSEDA